MNYGLNEDLENIQSDTKEKTKEKTKEITKENCSDIQKRIIDLIKENPKITVSQMSNVLDITIDSANYHIKKMKKRNLITHCGSTKNGYWEIISNALSGE